MLISLSPAAEPMRTTEPPPPAISAGIAARAVSHTPLRSMSSVRSQSSSGRSAASRPPPSTPALATITVICPVRHSSGDRGLKIRRPPYVAAHGDDPPSGGADQPHRLLEVLLRRGRHELPTGQSGTEVERHDVGAVLGQPEAVTAALPAGSARDECDPSGQRSSRRRPLQPVGRPTGEPFPSQIRTASGRSRLSIASRAPPVVPSANSREAVRMVRLLDRGAIVPSSTADRNSSKNTDPVRSTPPPSTSVPGLAKLTTPAIAVPITRAARRTAACTTSSPGRGGGADVLAGDPAGAGQPLGEHRAPSGAGLLGQGSDQRPSAGDRFEAAGLAAAAARGGVVGDVDVPDVAGRAAVAAVQPAVGDQAAADAGGHLHEEQVPAFARDAALPLPQRHQVDLVVHPDRHAVAGEEPGPDVEPGPARG